VKDELTYFTFVSVHSVKLTDLRIDRRHLH